jgi:hypothetical protein
MNNIRFRLAYAAALVVSVAACGGGGGSGGDGGTLVQGPGPTTPPPNASGPAGLWTGTLSNGREYNIYVLDDNTTWIFYSPGAGQGTIRGLMQGNGSASTANFTVSNLKDFDLVADTVNDAQLSAAYQARTAFGGQITYPSNNALNVAVPITSGASNYSTLYDATPAVSEVAGTYTNATLQTVGPEDFANINVAANGTFAIATASGCVITGSLAPRSSGNVFNVTGSFGNAPCATPGVAFSGNAFFLPRRADNQKQLTLWWTNGARTNAYVIAGTRP